MKNKMKKKAVFELSDATYDYEGAAGHALDSVSLVINQGDSVSLLGANGSGKSTLLKLLDGLYFSVKGEVKAFGEVISESSMRDNKFSRDFHSKVGFVFQDPDVQLFLPTVWDEVAFAPLQMGMEKERVKEIVSEALTSLGLYDLKDRPPYHLSEGEKKKVSIASILTLDPQVWLMDEPSASLDPKTKGWVIDFVMSLAENGKTIIIATHDLEIPYVATELCYVLGQDHKISALGTAIDILNNEEILLKANLIHKHRHVHNGVAHAHPHRHWFF